MMLRRLLASLLLLLMLPVTGFALGVGDPAPDFLLEDIPTGEPIALSDYAGRTVVLVFYAWW